VVAGGGVACVLLLSNFIEPYANQRFNALSASIAADLVSSTLRPGRFTQVTPGVILLIGGRSGDGEIIEFFADDRREPQMRRTYIAETARVSSDGENYVIELRDGTLQYAEADGRFSTISFARYDIGVEGLTQPVGLTDPMQEQDSIALIQAAMADGDWNSKRMMLLTNRMAEGLRVIGMTMMVLAMMAFPSGRRARIPIPMEAAVLLIAFGERGLSAYSPFGTATGALVLMAIAGAILVLRARPRRIPAAVIP
jgi:lipopolysaccharide export system permease protein